MAHFVRYALALILLAAAAGQARDSFAGIDSITSGNWIGTYGSQGYILNGYDGNPGNQGASPSIDVTSLPSYVSGYTYNSGIQEYVWDQNQASPSLNSRYLQDPGNPSGPRTAATAYTGGTSTITLDISEPAKFQLAVYGLDWENYAGGRNVTISVDGQKLTLDGANGYYAPGRTRCSISMQRPARWTSR